MRAWGSLRVVTEQKEAGEALCVSEDRFRLLADEAVEGIASIENGVLFDANKSFTQMFCYELGGLVKMSASPARVRRYDAECLSPGLPGVAKIPRGSLWALRVKHNQVPRNTEVR